MTQQRWIPWAIAVVALLLVFVSSTSAVPTATDLVLEQDPEVGSDAGPRLPSAAAIAEAEGGAVAADASTDTPAPADDPPATVAQSAPDPYAEGDDGYSAASSSEPAPAATAAAQEEEQPAAAEQAAQPAPAVAPAPQPPPAPVSVIEGYRLRVPRLGIDAFMIDLGVDDQGVMEVPREAQTVAWYRFTSVPGEPGNILLGGHITWGGATAVFRYLEEMTNGDQIFIDTPSGETIHYVVRETWWADPYARQDVRRVIGGRSGSQSITLFTCGGIWSTDAREYSHRRVVTAVRV